MARLPPGQGPAVFVPAARSPGTPAPPLQTAVESKAQRLAFGGFLLVAFGMVGFFLGAIAHWTVRFLSLGLVGAGIALLTAAQRQRRRLEAARWQALCGQKGWGYIEEDRHERPSFWRGVPPFGQGYSQAAQDIVSGTHLGVPFEAWTYRYTVKHGKHSRTYHFKVLVLAMPATSPGLTIQEEHLGHKVQDALGGEDIDFESLEFSKRFWVQSRDRRFAYDVLHPRAIAHVEAQGTSRSWHWKGNRLMVAEPGALRREAVLALWPVANPMRELVPAHVRSPR
jgi:hypothetical protein